MQGVGGAAAGGGGIGWGPYKKKIKKILCARGRGCKGGWPPIKKLGSNIFFLQLSRGHKGPSRWRKATSPTQELEVFARRAPYRLVY